MRGRVGGSVAACAHIHIDTHMCVHMKRYARCALRPDDRRLLEQCVTEDWGRGTSIGGPVHHLCHANDGVSERLNSRFDLAGDPNERGYTHTHTQSETYTQAHTEEVKANAHIHVLSQRCVCMPACALLYVCVWACLPVCMFLCVSVY
jgi:hypothetical protein